MREQIAAAHRRAGALLEEARILIHGRDRSQAREALARLAEALDAHFDQEDRLCHPTITALRPDRRTMLDRLAEAHRELRANLAEIALHLERGDLGESGAAYEAFTRSFRRHEKDEERLLRSLDEEIAGA